MISYLLVVVVTMIVLYMLSYDNLSYARKNF